MSDVGLLDEYRNRAELAHELRCSERTIWRYENLPDGLPSVLIAGRKFYRIEAVRDWLGKRERRPHPRRGK
jgi:hypothetical protein